MQGDDTPIFFVDFEGSRMSGILEFGVVTLQRGEIADTRGRLCRATGRISPEDLAVHGLPAEALVGEAPFSDEWEYFAGLRARGPLAAHFASAENSLIKSIWPYPRTGADFARPGRSATEWGPWIDTARLFEQVIPGVVSTRLETLVVRQGLQEQVDAVAAQHCPPGRRDYHCALYDALAGAVLLRWLLHLPEMATATIPWLLQMSTLDAEKRGALQQPDLW
jgi:DNA polymerase-3 subunit epsilon